MIRKFSSRRFSQAVAVLMTSTIVASPSWAQDMQQPDAPESASEANSDEGTLLDEIVVSGVKSDTVQVGSFRGARVLDTPLTVAVIDRELMDVQQVQNLGDVVKNTPGVSFSQVSPAVSTNLSVRGIPTENRTNYRLNGGLPVVNLIDMPIEAFERVEVLKGVSSLYYGFTTPAGIINMIAKRPTQDVQFGFNVFGNFSGGYGAHLDFGGMNSAGTIGARVNLLASRPDYGVDRTAGQRYFATLALDFKPLDNLNLRFDAQTIHKEITEPAIYQLTPAGGVIALPPLLDPTENLASEWMKTDAREYNLLGHLDWRFARDWEIVLEAGISNVERDRRLGLIRNLVLTPGATFGNAQMRVSLTNGLVFENRNLRGEVAGGFLTGPLKHQLTLGVTKNIRIAESAQVQNRDFAFNIFTRPSIPEQTLPARFVPNPGKITDTGYYAFDRVSYEELVDVLIGVRRTNYRNVTQAFLNTNPPTLAPVQPPIYKANVTSLSGGLVVKPMRNLSLYATYIEGLEEGGVAPQTVINPGEILPPNQSKQKEFGVKWEPMTRLLVTASYFDIDRASTFINAQNRFVQDGRTRYKGIETSLSGDVTDTLNLTLSAMRLDATQNRTADAALVGNVPENTPKWSGSAFANYKLPFLEGLSINGGLFYQGKRAVNNANQAFVPSYTTFSLGTALEVGNYLFRLSADNVTNKRYFAGTGGSLVSYGLPRIIKFTIGTKF